MQLSEDKIIQKNAKHCGHCNQNTLLSYENELTCISCGYNVIKENLNSLKHKEKQTNFINRVKYAEVKIFCICVDLYEVNEGKDYGTSDEEASST